MMSNFISLLKVHLIEQYKLNKLFKKNSLIKKIGTALLIILFASIFLVNLYFIYNITLNEAKPDEALTELLRIAFSLSSITMLITSLTQSYAYLFKGNDFDLVMSMPIKPKTIVGVKIAGLIINSYLLLLIVFSPLILILITNNLVNLIFYFNISLILMLFPFIIISITTLISFFIGIVFKNFKYKNLLVISLSILLIGSYFYLIFSNTSNDHSIFNMISNYLSYIYYPANLAIDALINYNFISLIIFSISNVLVFYLFLTIISKIYLKANTNLFKPKAKKIQNSKLKYNTSLKTLVKKEFKSYFSKTQYVINTLITKLLFPVLTIVFMVKLKNSDFTMDSTTISLIISGVGLFALTLTSTTNVSISLEKDTLWILKTMPVETKDIFISKMLVDIILNLVLSLISVISVVVFMPKINIFSLLMLVLFLIIISIYNSTLGLILNLKYPKFDWDLEIRAIKQSMSVFLQTIISFISIFIIGGLSAIIIVKTGNLLLIYISVLSIYLILTTILNLILFKKGPKWFLKL